MNRRTFITGLMAAAGGAAVERTFPFRTWFLPKVIKPRVSYFVPPLSDEVFRTSPLMIMESTARGREGFFYQQYMEQEMDARTKAIHISEVGRWPVVLDSDCDPSRFYLRPYLLDRMEWIEESSGSSIVLCPSSGIIPVEIATELVQAVSKYRMQERPVRPSPIRRPRSLRSVVREFVAPIERSVREALSSS